MPDQCIEIIHWGCIDTIDWKLHDMWIRDMSSSTTSRLAVMGERLSSFKRVASE
jgi:hypothetical protein